MMSKEKRRVPKLRFPGFTEDWEQRKADYIFKSVTEKGYPELPVLSASQELGMVYRDQNGIDIQHDKKNESSYKRVSPGQFVIHLRSFQGGFAYSEVEGITSPAYTGMSFKNSSEQYGLFWKYVFKSETFIKRLETITYGIRDGRSISFSDFKSLMLQYPSFSEQELIGDLIAVIERGITLHQRKLDNLKLKKKALLQKLFPKNGERYPELRFPGFTDAWEQRKLGKCVDISTGYPFDSQDFNENGEYLVITNGNIQENTPFVLNNVGNRIDLDDSLKKYILDIDDLLITMDGTVGRVAIVVNNKLVLAQRVCRIKSNEPYYIYQLLSKNNFIQSMNKIGHGGTIKHISLSEISEYQDFYPKSQKERIKISTVLTNCDKLITLHQRKLDHLQLQKKALLQQMFV